jgi:thioredoxin reductase (NADPH)
VLQALKSGAQLASPGQAVTLGTGRNGDPLRLHLQGGEVIDGKAVVIAAGARYRALPLERRPDFEGAGIYYAATELEARGCGQPGHGDRRRELRGSGGAVPGRAGQ